MRTLCGTNAVVAKRVAKQANSKPHSGALERRQVRRFRLLRAFKWQDIGRNMREIVCEWSWCVNSVQLQPRSLDVVYALNIIAFFYIHILLNTVAYF